MSGGEKPRKRVEDQAIRGRDVLIAYMVGVFFWGASGVGLVAVVRELAPKEKGEAMPASGLFLSGLALLCFFIVFRWLWLLFVVGVTKAEIVAHDLWLGERRLVVGGVLTALPMLMAVFVFRADFVEGAAWLFAVGALLVIAPVTAWIGDNRGAVGRIRRARKGVSPGGRLVLSADHSTTKSRAVGGGAGSSVEDQELVAKNDAALSGSPEVEGSRGASWVALPAAPVPVVVPGKFWVGMALGGGFFGAMWLQELRIKRGL